ncbi:MAG TPA: hypothetical protein VFB34_10640, partial [Chloroflexota bacterium]|nr:hypothetical protein [Chloroflexota bacterium]
FPLANQDESTYLPQNDEAARTAFALTDPTGDSLTLGPPRQYIAGGTNVPLVILRAPPVHFDQFGNQSYDVNNCFGSNLGTCGFSSSFSDSQQTTFSTDVTQTDSWEASATVSGGISYAGFDVEASLQGRYGNNFSHDSTSSVNTQVTVQVNANVDDYVFYRKTDYVVEEYPIYGAGNTSGQPNAYVAVITGVNTTYNFENTGPGASDAPMMDTIHQTGNLLSYPYYNPAGQAEPSNSIDDNPEVASSSSGNPVVSTPFPSISFGETGSASGQDSFANQTGQTISNTQTDGYTLTASVGYEQEGVPVKAKVEGSYQYDQSNFQSQSSSFGTTMQINWNTGNLNKSIPGTNYTVMPYLYWNRSGALVLDWEVQLPTSNSGVPTFWEQMYGHQSNPALNLPDLLDAAKGYAAPVGGLQFHDPEMVLTPAAPVPGTTLSVTTPIHNYSLMNEVGWPGVRYYLGDPAQGGYYIGTGTSGCYGTGDCLPSQYTALSGVHWQVPGGLGGRDIRIYASVDPGHAIPEVHYTDNTGWGFTHVYGYLRPTDDVSISGSDISSSAVNPAPGSTVTLRATVHGGAVASGPVQVRFWNGNPATNGGLITTTSVQSIPAGGTSTTPPVQWTVPNRPGQYSIYAQILPANDYDPNMANNTAGTTLTSPSLFVANTPNNTISSYPVGATGNVAPMAWIVGPATGLSGPRGLAVDTYGNLYVANQNSNSITEYAEGSNGNAAPIAVISGSATKLSQPEGLTMDGSGDIFVANQGNSSITEYLPGSHGNVAPKAIISGTSTGLSQPQGLTMGGNGDLLVANRAANTVTEYAPGASGNASPAATLGGAATALKLPQGVLFDAAGDLRVSNAGSNAVTIYAPGSKGNTAPLSTISGTSTGLSTPGGMDVNGSGQVAVPNAGAGSVTLFAAGATGNTMPAGTIVGSKTRLYHPSFVAFTPPPAAITGVATGITTTEAKLTGIETPDGSATRWFFQYRRKGVSTWSHTPAVYGGSGGFRVRVQSVVKSLQASTAYQFRLIAVNPGGEATGAVVSFTTK